MQIIVHFPSKQIKDIAIKVVQRNAFFSHLENVSYSNYSWEALIQKFAKRLLKRGCKYVANFNTIACDLVTDTVRKFIVPKINFLATCFHKVCNIEEMFQNNSFSKK